MAKLFMMQNRYANVQEPFVHRAKPLEVTSKAFCSSCKTVMQPFKAALFLLQNRMVISDI